jgi:hypothetical protein
MKPSHTKKQKTEPAPHQRASRIIAIHNDKKRNARTIAVGSGNDPHEALAAFLTSTGRLNPPRQTNLLLRRLRDAINDDPYRYEFRFKDIGWHIFVHL